MDKIKRLGCLGRLHWSDNSYFLPAAAIVVAFVLYFSGTGEAFISMDYNLTGSKTRSKGVTKDSSLFTQNYSLNYSKPIALTKTINLTGDIRAAKSISDDEKKKTESTTVAPSLNFSMNNPYFNFSSSYHTNEFPGISTGDTYSNDTWSSSFSMAPDDYPDLMLGLTKSATKSNSKNTASTQNSTYTNVIAGTSYKFDNISTIYNYSLSQSRDNVSLMESKSPTHFGKIGYNNSIFNKRLNFAFDYSRSNSVSETQSISQGKGFLDTLKNIETGLFKDDDSPVLGTLDNEDELIDGDKSTAIKDITGNVVDLNTANRNMGLKLQEAARIHTIYLNVTFDADKIDEETLEEFDYGWKVYTSSDGNNWVLFTQKNVLYDIENNRFKFILKSNKESAPLESYFKVVNTIKSDILLPDIQITEIEAEGTTTTDPFSIQKTEYDRQFVSGSVNFYISEKINLGYNLSFDISENSSESDSASEASVSDETKNFSNSVTLSYLHSRYFSFTSNALSQRRENSKSDDSGVNNILVSISSVPLDTINGSISVNRSESLTEGKMESNTNSGNLNMFLKLYTGADLGLGFASNNTESKDGQKENSQSANANLTLSPWSVFSMQVFGSKFYKTTDSPLTGRDVSPATTNLRLILNYNPSRFISINTNIQIEPQVERNFSVSSRLPGNLQLSLNYDRSNSNAESYGVSASWNMSKYIYFSTTYGISMANNADNDRSDRYAIRASIRF